MATKLRDPLKARQQSYVTGRSSDSSRGKMRTFVPDTFFKQEKADVEVGPLCSAAGKARQGEGSRGFSAVRNTLGQRRTRHNLLFCHSGRTVSLRYLRHFRRRGRAQCAPQRQSGSRLDGKGQG